MKFKEELNKRGLKFKWVAEKIDCNYQSFKVYLNNQNVMPSHIEEKLKEFLK